MRTISCLYGNPILYVVACLPVFMIIKTVTTTMIVAMLPNTDKLSIAGEEPGGDGGAVLQATLETRQGLEMKLGVALIVLMYSYIKLNRLAY
jgi:hypothetical protein